MKHLLDRFSPIVTIAFWFFLTLVLTGCSAQVSGTGKDGPQGPAGPQGLPGLQGPPGPPGEPGSFESSFVSPGTGIQATITNVTIGDDRLPVVTFTITDENGLPLALGDVQSVNFTIARIVVDPDTGKTKYTNYFTREVEGQQFTYKNEEKQPSLNKTTQPGFEPGEGIFNEVQPGEFTYTFGQALGDDFDPTATHVVGGEIIRGPRDVSANPLFTFVPTGGEPQVTRLISTTETCNSCHNPLAMHGGSRQEFGLCVLCHTAQNTDPESGNSLDMKVMIHRIHRGEGLPSVEAGFPYFIVGYRQSIIDFGSVAWPQDVRNCTTCHTGPDGDNYKTAPGPAACTSCHDDVNVVTGDNHPGGKKDEKQCPACHVLEGVEFDTSIVGAHTIPRLSTQIKGLHFEILKVETLTPGNSPAVTFKITDNNGNSIDPASMGYLALNLAGPTSDYAARVTEVVFRAPSDSAPEIETIEGGAYRYTFNYVLPMDVSGTYAVGMEGYVEESIDGVEDPVRVSSDNPVIYVAIDGNNPVTRRQVVDRDKCNVCHKELALHGGVRQNIEYCVMCHNPLATDEMRRPPEKLPPTSIDFKILIHRIHRGKDAAQPLEVYGYGGTLHDFSTVQFPGNLAACQTCHLPGSYGLPLDVNVHPTAITQAGVEIATILPIRSICGSCHDDPTSLGHMELQTTANGIETCAVCHGVGSEFDVFKVHD